MADFLLDSLYLRRRGVFFVGRRAGTEQGLSLSLIHISSSKTFGLIESLFTRFLKHGRGIHTFNENDNITC